MADKKAEQVKKPGAKDIEEQERKKHQPYWDDINQTRFVLYSDIMGFKNIIYNKSLSEVKEKFMTFATELKKKAKPLLGHGLKMIIFSDSIILATSNGDKDAFNRISKAAIRMLQIGMKAGFPISAAMAKGPFAFDTEQQLFVGKALVDAYLLQDEIFYYGIALHHTLEEDILNYKDTNPYHQLAIPLKAGVARHWQLSWHRLTTSLAKGDITDRANQWLDNIDKEISGRPRIYVENTRRNILAINSSYLPADD